MLERLVRPLFAAPARAALATSLVGAPLADELCRQLAAGDGPAPAVDAGGLRADAGIAIVEAAGVRREILAFLGGLRDAGIEHVVIKGMAAAYLLYPRPGLRLLPDVDILIRPVDLPRLARHLCDIGFGTVHVAGAARRWGALTISSFAPVGPADGSFLIDIHVAVDDPPPACRGVTTDEVFDAARLVETEGGTIRVPGDTHMFALLILNAFRDLYEPRGVKSLFDAALVLRTMPPDLAALQNLARRGGFVRRAVFYRELCHRLGVGDVAALFPHRRLGPLGRRMACIVSENMRAITLLRLPDAHKLALEMALYDSPLTVMKRNAGRIAGLMHPRGHDLPGVPVVRVEK